MAGENHILVLGDKQVGKRQLINRLSGTVYSDEYVPNMGFEAVSAKGIQFYKHTLDPNEETALLSTREEHYKKSRIALYCAHLSTEEAIDLTKRLESQVMEVVALNPAIRFILVGTKAERLDAAEQSGLIIQLKQEFDSNAHLRGRIQHIVFTSAKDNMGIVDLEARITQASKIQAIDEIMLLKTQLLPLSRRQKKLVNEQISIFIMQMQSEKFQKNPSKFIDNFVARCTVIANTKYPAPRVIFAMLAAFLIVTFAVWSIAITAAIAAHAFASFSLFLPAIGHSTLATSIVVLGPVLGAASSAWVRHSIFPPNLTPKVVYDTLDRIQECSTTSPRPNLGKGTLNQYPTDGMVETDEEESDEESDLLLRKNQ